MNDSWQLPDRVRVFLRLLAGEPVQPVPGHRDFFGFAVAKGTDVMRSSDSFIHQPQYPGTERLDTWLHADDMRLSQHPGLFCFYIRFYLVLYAEIPVQLGEPGKDFAEVRVVGDIVDHGDVQDLVVTDRG